MLLLLLLCFDPSTNQFELERSFSLLAAAAVCCLPIQHRRPLRCTTPCACCVCSSVMLCSAVQCSARALVSSRRPTRLALHFPFRPRRSSGGGGMSTTTIHLLSCLVQFTRDCISSSPSLLSSSLIPLSLSFSSLISDKLEET